MGEGQLIVRASEVSNLVVLPRATKDRGVILAETTKTWLKTKASEQFYGFKSFQGNKYTEKGNICESNAIQMLSEYHHFNSDEYKKNTERKTKDNFTGECDIFYDNSIIDTKCSWDLTTFPAFKEDADKLVKKSGYDWQQKCYLWLWGAERAYVAFCMVDTPDDLLTSWDNWELHKVEHIAPEKRITLSSEIVLTDEDIALFESQYILANKYYQELLIELNNK